MYSRIRILLVIVILSSSLIHAQLQEILSSISSDSLMQNMKELTGAAPVIINGKTDTIKTRAHLTTYNRRAQQYLKQKLESFGIETKTVNYHSNSFAGYNVSYTFAMMRDNKYWFCTDWGEIFSSTVFPEIESRNVSGIPFQHRLDWIEFFGSDTIISLGRAGYMVISADQGNSWKKINTGFSSLADLVNSGSMLIAAESKAKVWRSSDKGYNWSSVIINENFKIYDLSLLNSKYICAAGMDSSTNSGAVHVSYDNGSTWNSVKGSFPEPFISGGQASSNICLLTNKGKVYRSVTDGSFSLIYSPDTTITAKKLFFSDSLHGWILTKYNQLFRTSDKGYSWTYISKLNAPEVTENIMFTDSLNGIVTGRHHYGIVTTDGGVTWTDKTIPLAEAVVGFIPGYSEPGKAIMIAAHTDCILNEAPTYAVSGFELCPGADDDGSGTVAALELAKAFSKHPLGYTVAVAFVPTEELGHGSCAVTEFVMENTDTLLLGLDLDMIGYDSLNLSSLELGYMNSIGKRMSSNLAYFLEREGIPMKIIQKGRISTINICVPNSIPAFFIAEPPLGGSFLYNTNYHSITDNWESINYDYLTRTTKTVAMMAYFFSTAELVDVKDNPAASVYYLSEAYPNPFNPESNFNFSIPVAQHVSIKIFDILGREVEILYSAEMPAGTHQVTWNASAFSSGTYFCRLTAGSFSSVKKLILIK